jgi:hypothetical protein
MSLERLTYDGSTKLRDHLTLAGSDACEADVASRYNALPTRREDVPTLHLDPGGFAFSNTKPIVFELECVTGDTIKVSVKPEHIHGVLDLGTRTLEGQDWTKVYFGWCCLVLPTPVWEAIINVVLTLSHEHEDGWMVLAKRLSNPA